jgi:hypothetical protein
MVSVMLKLKIVGVERTYGISDVLFQENPPSTHIIHKTHTKKDNECAAVVVTSLAFASSTSTTSSGVSPNVAY